MGPSGASIFARRGLQAFWNAQPRRASLHPRAERDLFRGDVHPDLLCEQNHFWHGPAGRVAVVVLSLCGARTLLRRQMVHVAFRTSRRVHSFRDIQDSALGPFQPMDWLRPALGFRADDKRSVRLDRTVSAALARAAAARRAPRVDPLAGARGSGARSGLRALDDSELRRVSHLGSAAPEFRLRALAL